MSPQLDRLISRFEQLIRGDPARRGLTGADGAGPGQGELRHAARLLASTEPGRTIGIVTGFFVPRQTPDTESAPREPAVPDTNPPERADASSAEFPCAGSAETDGPPGAAVLAAVLSDLGFQPKIITDTACCEVVTAAISGIGLNTEHVITCPMGPSAENRWFETVRQTDWFRDLAAMISIERVGPSHDLQSIQVNDPEAFACGDFQKCVDRRAFSQCFNMRGQPIDHVSASLYRLFEGTLSATSEASGRPPAPESPDRASRWPGIPPERRPEYPTVGIGDGGNEIGMGKFRWSELRRRIRGAHGGLIPSRIAADHTIVAGTSNLGGLALAASVALLLDRTELLKRHTCAAQHVLLKRLVDQAGAVDGVTQATEPTVDGVPFLDGIEPWAAIRRELGLPD